MRRDGVGSHETEPSVEGVDGGRSIRDDGGETELAADDERDEARSMTENAPPLDSSDGDASAMRFEGDGTDASDVGALDAAAAAARVTRAAARGRRALGRSPRSISGGLSNCDGENGTPSSGSASAGAGDDDGLIGIGAIGVWVADRSATRPSGGEPMVVEKSDGGGDSSMFARPARRGSDPLGPARDAPELLEDDTGIGALVPTTRDAEGREPVRYTGPDGGEKSSVRSGRLLSAAAGASGLSSRAALLILYTRCACASVIVDAASLAVIGSLISPDGMWPLMGEKRSNRLRSSEISDDADSSPSSLSPAAGDADRSLPLALASRASSAATRVVVAGPAAAPGTVGAVTAGGDADFDCDADLAALRDALALLRLAELFFRAAAALDAPDADVDGPEAPP